MNQLDKISKKLYNGFITHSHDKKEAFAKLNDVQLINTWSNVTNKYLEVITNVTKSEARPKRFR